MLDELGVQFPWRCAPFPPVQDKLGNGLVDEFPVDAAALHDFHRVRAGPPVIVQPGGLLRLETFRLALLVAPPVGGNVLAEFVFPGVTGFAALAPVKNEILQLVQGELARYVVIEGQQLEEVFAGAPVQGQQPGTAPGRRRRRLVRLSAAVGASGNRPGRLPGSGPGSPQWSRGGELINNTPLSARLRLSRCRSSLSQNGRVPSR